MQMDRRPSSLSYSNTGLSNFALTPRGLDNDVVLFANHESDECSNKQAGKCPTSIDNAHRLPPRFPPSRCGPLPQSESDRSNMNLTVESFWLPELATAACEQALSYFTSSSCTDSDLDSLSSPRTPPHSSLRSLSPALIPDHLHSVNPIVAVSPRQVQRDLYAGSHPPINKRKDCQPTCQEGSLFLF